MLCISALSKFHYLPLSTSHIQFMANLTASQINPVFACFSPLTRPLQPLFSRHSTIAIPPFPPLKSSGLRRHNAFSRRTDPIRLVEVGVDVSAEMSGLIMRRHDTEQSRTYKFGQILCALWSIGAANPAGSAAGHTVADTAIASTPISAGLRCVLHLWEGQPNSQKPRPGSSIYSRLGGVQKHLWPKYNANTHGVAYVDSTLRKVDGQKHAHRRFSV